MCLAIQLTVNFMIELKCGQTVLKMKNNLAIYSICLCTLTIDLIIT